MARNTSIVACGRKQNIGCRVVLWDEEEGLSFYKKGKLYKRNLPLEDLRKQINCFVVHHSVTYRAKHMFNGLNARGLSVNFMIDDDVNEDGFATIYQCADIKDACWSHGNLNRSGPGVEISYHPQAWENPNMYSEYNQKKFDVQPHEIVTDTIHGQRFGKVFAPTEAQIKSCIRLIWGFCELFPDVKSEFPKYGDGSIIKTTIDNPRGLLAHFHITRRKIDPAAFPFERAEMEVGELLKKGLVKLPRITRMKYFLKRMMRKTK